ncbi:MAG: nucleotidyltransferase domain-containing protein [Fibromonadaceae bacterium]|jgi:predicted nucleotidyltransferase|nr:nucleotidyltransferase domain-containing protein [Fibromonadaceae bacterium]
MSLPADVISKIVQCLMGLNVYKIILFGSYANNTATEDSDIDLAVILDTEEFAKSCDERLDRKRPIKIAQPTSLSLNVQQKYPKIQFFCFRKVPLLK